MNPWQRIIVALDVDSRKDALDLVEQLRGRVGLFKVGSQLFTQEGPALIREIVGMGERVFLDLKFHDIPNTVAKAVLAAVPLGVSMITVHASGGSKMLVAAAEALRPAIGQRPLVLGVTVLTSMDGEDLAEIGCERSLREHAAKLTRLAEAAGLDGIVVSPEEVALVRQQLSKPMLIVTPGIRPAGSSKDDQNRTASPKLAVQAGADYLVIGRPITASVDPLKSLEEILQSMR